MPADIVIYGIVAAGLVLWLRSVLGTRHGGERERPNPFTAAPEKAGRGAAGLPAPQGAITPPAATAADLHKSLPRHMAITGGAATESGLMEIIQADRGFDLAHFMTGAQDAFVMIVEAFAAGERDTLRDFLSPSVHDAFAAALDARARAQESASVEIHAVRHIDIVDARLDGRQALITLRFVADETNLLRDAQGTLLHGNPDRITETIDIWTFSRDVRSKSPAWLLSETRDEDASAETVKTVPDSR